MAFTNELEAAQDLLADSTNLRTFLGAADAAAAKAKLYFNSSTGASRPYGVLWSGQIHTAEDGFDDGVIHVLLKQDVAAGADHETESDTLADLARSIRNDLMTLAVDGTKERLFINPKSGIVQGENSGTVQRSDGDAEGAFWQLHLVIRYGARR